MNRSQPMMMPQSDTMGTMTIEMLVPGNKVGLIIGKGGETIKQLQVCGGTVFCIALCQPRLFPG